MWILCFLILIMPFEANPYLYISQSFLGIFPDFTMIKLVGLIGLVYSAYRVASTGVRIRILGSQQSAFFFTFILIIILTGLLNGVVSRPLSRVLSIILLLPLLLVVVRTEKDLITTIKAAVFSMILVFPYGLRQTARFGGRYGVGLHEPNYLALALVLIIPLAFVLARHASTSMRRGMWFLAGLVLAAAAVLTGSRGGFIGLVLVAILFVQKLTKQRFTSLALVGLCLACIVLFIPNPLIKRLMSTDDDPSTRTSVERSNEARLVELKGGLRMVRARPITGVGLGNFSVWMEGYADLESDNIAHNSYLEVAAELGLPALFVFLLVLLATYRSLSRSARIAQRAGAAKLRDLVLALQVGFLGYTIAAVFLSAQFEKYWWFAIFLSICFERVAVVEKSKQADRLDARVVKPSPIARPGVTIGQRL